MSGFLLDLSAQVRCLHGGQVQLQAGKVSRVKIMGQALLFQTIPDSISGCPYIPSAGNGPCTSAQWISGSKRIKVNSVPVLLFDSQATCIPTGTGVNVVKTQTRVKGI